jgi:hypothetical protein
MGGKTNMTTKRILFCLTLLGVGISSLPARVTKLDPFRVPLARLEEESDPRRNPGNPFDDYTNLRVNSDNSGQVQNEEQACISPVDPNVFVSVWRDFRLGYRRIGVGYSHDKGLTWTDTLFPQMYYDWQSDPTLVVDENGVFTANVITFVPPAGGGLPSGILQVTSTDGGETWRDSVWAFGTPEEPRGFTDKQSLAIDLSGSPYHGTFYCTWTHFFDNFPFANQILLTYKRPGQDYSAPVFVSDSNNTQWSNVCVGADGQVYVSWITWWYSAIQFSRSLDGGVTWSPQENIVFPHFLNAEVNPALLIFAYGAMACDLSDGPYSGRLYMVYTDATPSLSETDIFLIYSDDDGVTWTQGHQLNDDPDSLTVDQFHPWITVDEQGRIWVLFYDRRNDPVNNLLMDTYFTVSADGGQTWRANERISTQSSDPGAGSLDAGLIGEYIGWQVRGGDALAVWTDTRSGNQDVYSAVLDSVFAEESAGEPRAAIPTQIAVSAYPNPTNGMSSLTYSLPVSAEVRLNLYDVTGRLARLFNLGVCDAGEHATSLNLDGLASGIYIVEVKAEVASARTKLVLLK